MIAELLTRMTTIHSLSTTPRSLSITLPQAEAAACKNLTASDFDCRVNGILISAASQNCTLGLDVVATCSVANDTVACDVRRRRRRGMRWRGEGGGE